MGICKSIPSTVTYQNNQLNQNDLKQTVQEFNLESNESLEYYQFSQKQCNFTFDQYQQTNLYQPKNKSQLDQRELCLAIAFNTEQSLMVAGCDYDKIKIFSFNDGYLELIQVVHSQHKHIISQLLFMKGSSKFISGSLDNDIRIWIIDESLKCKLYQLLENGHNTAISTLINNDQNLIISCDYHTIKFWKSSSSFWKCSQTLFFGDDRKSSLSLNDSSDVLIALGSKEILILYLGKDNIWRKMQRLGTQKSGNQLCFIENNIIAFQWQYLSKIEFYEFSNSKQIFVKMNEISVTSKEERDIDQEFQMTFIEKKKILLVKHGSCLYVLRRFENNEFILQQTLDISALNIWGSCSDDGRFLVMWVYETKSFRIWEYY